MEYKTKGNDFYKKGKLNEAVEWYTKAADMNIRHESMAAIFSNRAQCHIKMENNGAALVDADLALENDKKFYKAYYRKGSAYLALGRLKEALQNLRKVKKMGIKDK